MSQKLQYLAPLKLVVLFLGISMFVISCRKSEDTANPNGETPVKSMKDLVVPYNFEWNTTINVVFSIQAKDNKDYPLAGVRFRVYNASPDSGGVYMFGGVTDATGTWSTTQPLPAYLTKVTVTNNYVGLIREQVMAVTGGQVTGLFGGVTPQPLQQKAASGIIPSSLPGVYYMGTFNNQGVPNYLVSPNDPVDAVLLNDLNATLPEYQPVPTNHPEYLNSTVPNNLPLTELCDLWVTYITEGAGWKNSVGFFVFDTDNPPANAAAIDSIKIVFPNMSNTGSGGGLNPGNKVYMGRYPAGKSVGWVIFANGWDGSKVTNGSYRIYSIPSLNPETDPNLKKHTILLRDATRLSILLGFEDWRRDQGSDQDFNDGILYVKANPVTGINTDGMPLVSTTQTDTDGDGVPDVTDEYPSDPLKAFNNYYPNKSGHGSLAFEDLYPSQGDYDFNDLVISYRFNQITNAQNQVVAIHAELIPEAMGATLHNSFAFQMNLAANLVQSVSGNEIRHGFINVAANGVESGQRKAVIVVFDDAWDVLPPAGGGIGTNTEPGAPYVIPDTLQVVVTLNQPVSQAELGLPPYNPFIIVDRNRIREVHLSDYPPTDLVDGSDWGDFSDDSNPAIGRYYKTQTNLPWAINISDKFSYLYEKEAINTGYLKFNSWAESGGTLYPDWYVNTAAGYRNSSKLYSH